MTVLHSWHVYFLVVPLLPLQLNLECPGLSPHDVSGAATGRFGLRSLGSVLATNGVGGSPFASVARDRRGAHLFLAGVSTGSKRGVSVLGSTDTGIPCFGCSLSMTGVLFENGCPSVATLCNEILGGFEVIRLGRLSKKLDLSNRRILEVGLTSTLR